ncbi:sugar ABC transporter ATP-binding protein [Nocardioides sp. SYSU D00065]|uniref:sugar ABC transporter ATP-binding protein n=1 Tax=Nocardioides sp. SYSU D00065 TaxID=2817378 RepID=UPI001B3352F1|nr:sugar ABC transporter ATP-binding protein [Nocardioides sp. SYSU D00065]
MVTSATAPARPHVVVDVRDLTKSFGGVPVLRGVSLGLRRGEVTALAGENGAGKSTLIKIIAGQLRADGGYVEVEGGARPTSVRAAHAAGVAIVPQELAPVLDMTVYENIFLGRELTSRVGTLDRRSMRSRARGLLEEFGVDIDPGIPMRRLSVALQQIVEIVKNSSSGSKVLLLDEPTSAISEREVERLYDVVERLKQKGVAMVYTTHKMAEIRALADRVVVLRDGVLTRDEALDDITDDGIVSAMIGRELGELFPERGTPQDEPVLRVTGLRLDKDEPPVDLEARPGEIVALAGLVGAGRTELLEALMGVRRPASGTVTVAGHDVRGSGPKAAIARGMALVPEDRKVGGVVLGMSVVENVVLPHLATFSTLGWLHRRKARGAAHDAMSTVRLRSASDNPAVRNLSGGNQQKVVLGKWLTGDVKVLLLDEPTRGVDVGARGEIYRAITELASRGMAVLMASSDMTEVLGLAHRVLVVRDGQIAGELSGAALRHPDVQDHIFRLASGMTTRSFA